MGKKKGKRKRSKSSGAGSNDVTQKGPKPPKRPSTLVEKEPTNQQEPQKKKRALSDDSRAAEKRSNAATKEKGDNRSRNDLWDDDDRNDHGDDRDDNDRNPFRRTLDGFLSTLTQDELESFFSDAHVPPERRAQLWMQQAEIGEDLVNRYSWAVPDTACLDILSHFSPIVEVGCGANAYWCRQMKHAGIDVVGYDVAPTKGGRITGDNDDDNDKTRPTDGFVVKKGGPEVLSQHKDRTLFLCYPDENDDTPDDNAEDENNLSLGEACLQQFEGEYVIHVGELYGDTLSAAQAPWGRSSSPMFQQQLAAEYHCVLKLPLSSGWLHVRDSLSVWKRSKLCSIVFAPEEDDDDVEEEVQYRHVPVEERLPQSVAAPYLAHLLPEPAATEATTATTQTNVETPDPATDRRNDDHGAGVSSNENDKSSSPTSAEKLSSEALEDAEQTKEMGPHKEKKETVIHSDTARKQKSKKKKSKKKKSKTQDMAAEPAGGYECPW